MAQDPLEWLDEAFLASALQGEDDGKVTIVKFSATPAVAKGNNYMSHLYRVRVLYTLAESDLIVNSFIIKIPIPKSAFTEVLDSTDFYAREPRIYKELLPIFNKLVSCEFGPTFFHCPIKDGMVLKDMKEEGYIMCDKFKQLDFSHCKLVFTKLAKFHASSVACYHKNPDLVRELGEDTMYTTKSELFVPFTKTSLKCFGKVLSEMDGCERIVEWLTSRKEDFIKSIADICQPKSNGLNVLNHGDLWVNNMLFKHSDSGEVEDVKFIDYQLTRWSSPVQDLLYFVWTSANEEVRETRQKELYSFYRHTLNSSLEQLGCPERLSEQELEDDLRAAVGYVLITISGALPFMYSESDDAFNMEELSADDMKTFDKIEPLYSKKRYTEILPKMMKQFQDLIDS
ncbi:uncharacterized protein LOC124363436 [Homalodisca vitripennis]|uniref:uncharacterized protein LOC124363436 n=1 Tax=Homalodisca vitripennis TaxID=197043 RepID=UPI001EECEB49|nr:uncharacterized protein LOC124363436 [Homalodisca vitripennis]